MKKSEVSSQVFVYSAGLIIISMTLLFGIVAINKFRESTLENQRLQLERDFNKIVHEMKNDFGSVQVEKFKISQKIKSVCIIDLNNIISDELIQYPLIHDSVKQGVKENVFLVTDNLFNSFYIDSIGFESSPYYSCYPVINGNIELRFTSKGNRVVLMQYLKKEYCENANFPDPYMCAGLDVAFGSGYKYECCTKYNLCC